MAVKDVLADKTRHKMRIPLQGSPTLTSSPHSFTNGFIQGCKYVNCFPVEVPQFGADPIHCLNKAPGIDASGVTLNVSQVGSLGAIGWNTMGTITQYFDQDGVWTASAGLSSSNVYYGQLFATAPQVVPQLNLGAETTVGPLCKVYNQVGNTSNPYYFFITTNGSGFNTNLINVTAVTTGVSTYAGTTVGFVTAVPPVYMNNRAFWLDISTGLIYNTDPINGSTATFTAGSFIAPQIVADKYFGLVKYRNHICVIGEYSIEFFYDSGISLGSPLARQEQYLIRHGCTNINNVFIYGDIMYFLGLSDTQGWGLYEVANFNLRKVSPPAIDAILNNIDDFTGQASPQCTINLVDVFGHAVLLFQFQNYSGANTVQFVFEIPKRPYGIMAPTDGQWWEWPLMSTIPQGQKHWIGGGPQSFYKHPQIFHTLPLATGMTNQGTLVTSFQNTNAYNAIPASFYWTYPTNTTLTANFLSKNRATSTSVTSTYITEVQDFDTNVQKHIEYLDAVGDFGNNTVTVSYTTDPTYQTSNWVQMRTQTQSTNGPKYALRWYNIGPARTLALRYDFTGTSNINYKASEISVNFGNV